MPLETSRNYFIAATDVVLYDRPGGGDGINHLLLGDWLSYLGETQNGWAKVRCRGDQGWLRETDITPERALEVNFVDIGQGDGCHIVTPDDQIMLIDAGVGSNMNRFLSWRYNLRGRNVGGTPDFDPEEEDQHPWKIDYVVISHPDKDHYYGLKWVFENPKLNFGHIYHNGIVERPEEDEVDDLDYPDDLGGYATSGGQRYLWDVVDSDARMKALISAHPRTRKLYLSTLREARDNSPDAPFEALSVPMAALDQPVHVDGFGPDAPISLRVLGPLTEAVEFSGQTRPCLRELGKEGVTKNGHSVIFKLRYQRLEIMLGGDLNTEAQDFLLSAYSGVPDAASKLESEIARLRAAGDARTEENSRTLAEKERTLDALVAAARQTFACDVTKACHHGSTHFSNAFLKSLNAVATVISSGDEEGWAHPRPDALGAFGKHGRGERPLIFSTELARATREFTPMLDHLNTLRAFEARLELASSERERRRIEKELEEAKDRNVAVYGMITLRALGDTVILAQKLEAPTNQSRKWDIHELTHNPHTGVFETASH